MERKEGNVKRAWLKGGEWYVGRSLQDQLPRQTNPDQGSATRTAARIQPNLAESRARKFSLLFSNSDRNRPYRVFRGRVGNNVEMGKGDRVLCDYFDSRRRRAPVALAGLPLRIALTGSDAPSLGYSREMSVKMQFDPVSKNDPVRHLIE